MSYSLALYLLQFIFIGFLYRYLLSQRRQMSGASNGTSDTAGEAGRKAWWAILILENVFLVIWVLVGLYLFYLFFYQW